MFPSSPHSDPTSAGLTPTAPPSPDGPVAQHMNIQEIGEYRVVRRIGQGGMGVVLEAEDTRLRRRVAIKVMRPAIASDARARERFLREARAAAAVSHDHIVPIFHVGEHDSI